MPQHTSDSVPIFLPYTSLVLTSHGHQQLRGSHSLTQHHLLPVLQLRSGLMGMTNWWIGGSTYMIETSVHLNLKFNKRHFISTSMNPHGAIPLKLSPGVEDSA